MHPNRGAFLATAAVGAAIIADAEPARAAKTILGDYPAMAAVLGRPARHRVIFGAPYIHNGECLRSGHLLTAYQFANGENPPNVNLAILLYGPSSIMLAMDDAWWGESKAFELCAAEHDLPPEINREARNPFYHAHSSMNPNDDPRDPNGFYLDASVEAMTKRGAQWLICANALQTAARILKRLNNGGDEEAYVKQMISHLLPKTTVVPSAYQALIVAQQEYHFAYIAGG